MNTLISRSSGVASAAALTAALASGGAVAQSTQVQIYGAIGLDVVSASKVYNGTDAKSVVKVEDNAIVNSRIGLRGSEDLGGGLKALFNLESSIAPDTGTARAQFWNRGAWVGLQGELGTIKFGQQWNVADDYLCGYFVCAYYAPFLMSGFYALSDYYSNAIKYTSPNFGGFETGVYYSAGEQAGKQSAGQKFQVALNYAAGPFGIGGAIFSEKNTTGLTSGNSMYALGASYDFGVAKGRLGVATAEVNYATPFKARLIDVGVDVPVSDALTASLDYVGKDVKDSGDDTWFLRGRASYALSKRTALNFNVIYLKNKGNANFAFISELPGFAGQPGQKQTILTAGITHAF